MDNKHIPYLNVVVGACIIAVAGYAVLSIYVVMYLKDATMMGDTIGTWKSFAVLAFGFWIGSSSGGKTKQDNQDVTITNKPNDPVPTTTEGETK